MPPKAKTEQAPAEQEITELEKFEPTRVDGVKAGANGFPILMMKALPVAEPTETVKAEAADMERPAGLPDWHPAAATLARLGAAAPTVPAATLLKAIGADGVVDEQPDIDGGQQAIALIARLIGYEADELAAGCYDESYDISLLVSAIDCLKCWLRHEQAAQDGVEESPMEGIVMDSVADPTPPTVDPVAEGTKTVDTGNAGRDDLQKMVADAVTEATKGLEERLAAAQTELAKVKAQPIPGGPVMSIAQPPAAVRTTDRTAKAAYYRSMADSLSSPADADAYRQLARQLEETPATG